MASSPLDSTTELESLRAECDRLRRENEQLRTRLGLLVGTPDQNSRTEEAPPELRATADAPVTHASPGTAKVSLFRDLFRGREDVYPLR